MEQAVLKKTIISSIITVILAGGSIGTWYVLKDPEPEKVSTTKQKVELPNGQNVTVTVNNILGGAAKPEASVPTPTQATVVLPEMKQASAPVNKTQTLMQQSPVVVADQQQAVQQQPPAPQSHLLISDNSGGTNGQDSNQITGTNTSIGTGQIDSQLTKQKSPYTIFAGTFIPATMVTGLNSELKGEVLATVRQNVYDSTTGKYLLIPQGTRLIGTYDNAVAYGMNRLVVGWNRAILPNGASFLLRGMPSTDLQGFSGVSGTVDNHLVQVFGSAFLMGGIMAAPAVAMGSGGGSALNQPTATQTMVQMISAQTAQAGLQVVNKGMNIPPTIILSPGYQFNLLLTADLVTKPYIYKGVTG